MEKLLAGDELSCLNCGACCAHFRVSFYWAEADINQIPDHYVQALTPSLACMRGTHQTMPRCSALEGEVGQAVKCKIYHHRPSPCHEVQVGDEKCMRARARYGLTTSNDYTGQKNTPSEMAY